METKKFSFGRLNKQSFNIDTTNYGYCKLADLYNTDGADVIHKIDGVYIHRSPLGESPVIIDVNYKRLVNIPAHLTETFKNILSDVEAVEAIKQGHAGYTIYEYESHGRKCYSINFVDL